MNLHEMRQLLDARGIRLTKSLGQNFLHDANQLRRIAALAEITPADNILEIGPGLGPLTELLLAQSGHVLAIEMDQRLVAVLQERFKNQNLELLHADALRYLKQNERDWSQWKLVANLPYSVASPILVELALADHPPKCMVVTLQEEVALRLMAQADTDDYGILTLLVQLTFEPAGHFRIPPGSFFPAPEVDSACIKLVRREQPLLPRELLRTFEKLVKGGFSQRRKMMFKLLKGSFPQDKLTAAFEKLNLSPQIRAEKVTLHQFVSLAKELGT